MTKLLSVWCTGNMCVWKWLGKIRQFTRCGHLKAFQKHAQSGLSKWKSSPSLPHPHMFPSRLSLLNSAHWGHMKRDPWEMLSFSLPRKLCTSALTFALLTLSLLPSVGASRKLFYFFSYFHFNSLPVRFPIPGWSFLTSFSPLSLVLSTKGEMGVTFWSRPFLVIRVSKWQHLVNCWIFVKS